MNMKQTILTIALTAVCSLSQAQIKAITENGEEVVLFENGQWEYTEGNEYVEEEILMNPVKFTRPATSAFLLKSTKFNVGTYLDSKKWRESILGLILI